jgi:hypothetical protein
MNNPFQYGRPVDPKEFIEIDVHLLLTIVGRIINRESTAIISEPRFGKTSLLNYLCSNKITKGINLIQKEWTLIFRYIDTHLLLSDSVSQQVFWYYALNPIEKYLKQNPNSPLNTAFRECEKRAFNSFSVQDLIEQMQEYKIRLILMIDEFDAFLVHKNLGNGDFFGTLRSLATQTESLVLVITSRLDLSDLNRQTQKVHYTGSPYFNHFIQIVLPPFSTKAANSLLSRAGDRFSNAEKEYLTQISGMHPYFLQMVAHCLWDAYELNINEPVDRLNYVWKQACDQSPIILNNTWDYWSIRVKQTFTIIALNDMPRLIGKDTFDTAALMETLNNCDQELRFLENRGFILKKENKLLVLKLQHSGLLIA